MRFAAAIGALSFAAIVTSSPDVRACGGCFHQQQASPENASVVTDHRMALSVTPAQTVLWDQVRYQGNPVDFAWVLPVGQGAFVELARDEWLASLEALTAPTISAPPLPSRCGSYGGGGGAGCGAASVSSYGGGYPYGNGDDAGFQSGGGVDVISQSVVGPYLAVTIRSTSGEAISQWLLDNGFEIPTNIQPVLDAYTTEGFDFIALRLAPNEGVQAMQPVRVISPGADPTLPLRMVAAGIGSSVGLTLYVVAEGRYETSDFPSLLIDRTKVLWNPTGASSNYANLFDEAVSSGQGWVTEASVSASELESVYKKTCTNLPKVPVPCATQDGGADDAGGDDAATADDAGIDEASTDDGAAADDASASEGGADEASTDDASTTDEGGLGDADADDAASDAPATCVDYVSACSLFTDYDTATNATATYALRITRLRTTLPASALSKDLRLGASADQSTLSNAITATDYTVPNYDPCPAAPTDTSSTSCFCDTAAPTNEVMSTSLAIVALVGIARRRRRARTD